ncbi:VWA domain-containing protein [Roseibium sp. CAU 1637]|uniref:VWA domain-containing protein n=1 Tax=Roseibium limicola TaxID=2816037 RepID=A0A939EM92_9HYPH|nr:VWA domain-containing protein [Roseibium limicola]MBO0344760.1 VWA domain-containing protein [Roseibium limicola]
MSKSSKEPNRSVSAPKPEVQVDVSSADQVSAFLQTAARVPVSGSGHQPSVTVSTRSPGGRLIFALDATMSRQATWDQALHIQSEMFHVADQVSGLAVKLVYFRGFGECRASRWMEKGTELAAVMRRISCQGGRTQIAKVLKSALDETAKGKVSALVYVGDCMEENVDQLCARAGELGLHRVPIFLFQEGNDPAATEAFAEIARLSGGAHCAFTSGAAGRLADLLKAVAVYASGGRDALVKLQGEGDRGARLLLERMQR